MKSYITEARAFLLVILKNYSMGSLYLGLPRVVAIAVTLVTLPLILANLSPEDYGSLQFILAVQVWLVSVSAGHITIGAQRGIARGLRGTFLFAVIARLKFILPLGAVAVATGVVAYLLGFTTLGVLLGIMGVYLVVGYLPEVSYPSIFIAQKNFRQIAIWRSVAAVLLPVSTAAAAILTHNIIIFALVHFGVSALLSAAGFVYVIIKYRLLEAFKQGSIDADPLEYGVKMIPADLISQTAQKMTDFIIGPFFGFGSLAVFAVARNLERQARSPMKLLHNLLYSDFSTGELGKVSAMVRTKFAMLAFFSLFFSMGIAVVGALYIHLFLPASYQQAVLYFAILSLSLPAVLLQTILHTILATNLRHQELSRLIITSSIIQIAAIGLGGLALGILGVIGGVVVGTWAAFILFFQATMKKAAQQS